MNKIFKFFIISLVSLGILLTLSTGCNSKTQALKLIPNKKISELKLRNFLTRTIKIKNLAEQKKIIDIINSVNITEVGIQSRDGCGHGVEITFTDGTKLGANFLGDYVGYSYNGKNTWYSIDKRIDDKLGEIFDKNLIDPSNEDYDNHTPGRVEFIAPAVAAKIYKNTLVYLAPKTGLKLVELLPKKNIISIPSKTSEVGSFSIYGDKVVWSDYRREADKRRRFDNKQKPNSDIYMYDLKTKKTTRITSNLATQTNPSIWKNYIVWQDNRNDNLKSKSTNWDIYLYNITTGKEFRITKGQGNPQNPTIDNFKVVWEATKNGNSDIYMYDIEAKKEVRLSTSKYEDIKPKIFYNLVVWQSKLSLANSDIMLYDIANKKLDNLTKDSYNQADPTINSGFLAWAEEKNGPASNDVLINGKAPTSNIVVHNISGAELFNNTAVNIQIQPELSRNWLVFISAKQTCPEVWVCRYRW